MIIVVSSNTVVRDNGMTARMRRVFVVVTGGVVHVLGLIFESARWAHSLRFGGTFMARDGSIGLGLGAGEDS